MYLFNKENLIMNKRRSQMADSTYLVILGKASVTLTTQYENEQLEAILNKGRSEATYINFSMNCPHDRKHQNLIVIEILGIGRFGTTEPDKWKIDGNIAWATCMGAGQKVSIAFSTKTQAGEAEFMLGIFKN